jgi:hypothetical protein
MVQDGTVKINFTENNSCRGSAVSSSVRLHKIELTNDVLPTSRNGDRRANTEVQCVPASDVAGLSAFEIYDLAY